MADNEKFTPEEEDVRNQAMLQDLRYMHAPVDEAQSLERVRARLLATQSTFTLNSMQTSRQFMHNIKQGRIQSMHDMPIPIARKKGRYLNMLAVGVIAALLIGSLLFVVTRVHQSNTGSGGPTNSSPVSKPTPQPTCDPGSKPTSVPTLQPTCVPGSKPTPVPIAQPTAVSPVPIAQPTAVSPVPTAQPTPSH